MKMQEKSRGFTLIELLVVIAIIGLLSSMVLASLNTARSKARDARRLADINQIQKALEFHYDDHGSYPIMGWGNSTPAGSWTTFQTQLAAYMSTLPKDPQNTGGYTYGGGYTYSYYSSGYGGSGQWYMLLFRLENSPHSFEEQDGLTACDNTYFHYGSGSNGIVTVGGSCTF